MTKAPRAGEVKTRLTPPLTAEEAAALNICFLRDTAGVISLAATKSKTRGCAIYTPVGSAGEYNDIIPAFFELLPQRGETLGERIIFAFEDLFSLGFASVCLLGSDSPTIPPEAFMEAATVLEQPEKTVVLGPTEDGGYYLIGLNRQEKSLFKDISWSTERVHEQTCARARQQGLKIHFLPIGYDVDDASALRRLCEELFVRNWNKVTASPAPVTQDYLERLFKGGGRERIGLGASWSK